MKQGFKSVLNSCLEVSLSRKSSLLTVICMFMCKPIARVLQNSSAHCRTTRSLVSNTGRSFSIHFRNSRCWTLSRGSVCQSVVSSVGVVLAVMKSFLCVGYWNETKTQIFYKNPKEVMSMLVPCLSASLISILLILA